jgi:hypothetical protein
VRVGVRLAERAVGEGSIDSVERRRGVGNISVDSGDCMKKVQTGGSAGDVT